jgi:hypothetical protein
LACDAVGVFNSLSWVIWDSEYLARVVEREFQMLGNPDESPEEFSTVLSS